MIRLHDCSKHPSINFLTYFCEKIEFNWNFFSFFSQVSKNLFIFFIFKVFLKKIKIFYFFIYFKLIFVYIFKSFWCVDIKNKFKKIK